MWLEQLHKLRTLVFSSVKWTDVCTVTWDDAWHRRKHMVNIRKLPLLSSLFFLSMFITCVTEKEHSEPKIARLEGKWEMKSSVREQVPGAKCSWSPKVSWICSAEKERCCQSWEVARGKVCVHIYKKWMLSLVDLQPIPFACEVASPWSYVPNLGVRWLSNSQSTVTFSSLLCSVPGIIGIQAESARWMTRDMVWMNIYIKLTVLPEKTPQENCHYSDYWAIQ